MLLTIFHRDVIDSAVNSTAFFTVSISVSIINGKNSSRSKAADVVCIHSYLIAGISEVPVLYTEWMQ